MKQMGNVLLIDGDESRRQQLETVLTFMGMQWQSGAEEDCLAYLDAAARFSRRVHVVCGHCFVFAEKIPHAFSATDAGR